MSQGPEVLPQHVGVILDGNRRWAKAHGVTTAEGHKAGFDALFNLLPAVQERGIQYITIYAFSTENWQRASSEVKGIMRLLHWVVSHKLRALKEQGVRVVIVGDKEQLPQSERRALEQAETETAENTKLTLGVCFNYGGQQEIVDAAKHILQDSLDPQALTTETFADYLYAPELPPLDLIIRTSGEERLSNFMLWRAAYAELIFVDKYWPDYNAHDLDEALAKYASRQRRHGK